jgi:predicted nucleic acid-binding protein
MSVLIDTSVWSQAFRRHAVDGGSDVIRELRELIADGNALVIGPIRQELLSGIKQPSQFDELRNRMRAFPDVKLESADYERAAEQYTECRRNGIQGSNTDFLICAVAERIQAAIFTIDDDFIHFSNLMPIRIHRSRFGEV